MRSAILCTLLQFSLLACAWLPNERHLSPRQKSTSSLASGDSIRSIPDSKRSIDDGPRSNATIKIRGVNLGSLFVMEPWMALDTWSNMGCGAYEAEAECVKGLGQAAANKTFEKHWATWIEQSDLQNMTALGLNAIRVPVGFWINEALVHAHEHFPQGGLDHLEQVCGWAADLGMYVILDLHGAPGAQKANASFTGQIVPKAGFYQNSEYARAYTFLQWATKLIHTNSNFRTVGMLEVANEPIGDEPSLIEVYYPGAVLAVQQAEAELKVDPTDALTVQFMDLRWGAGNPASHLPGGNDTLPVAFDTHRYLFAEDHLASTRTAYLNATCSYKDVEDNSPRLIGEWSLAAEPENGSEFGLDTPGAADFYRSWWAAQVQVYEDHLGWVFWSWKTDLTDYRWDYQKAVAAGIIPTSPSQAYNMTPCAGSK